MPHPSSSRCLLPLLAPLALLAGCGGGGEGEVGSVDLKQYLPAFAAPLPMAADVLSGGILIGQDVLDQATNLLRQPDYDMSRATITWIRQNIDPRVPANASNHPLMSSGAAIAHAAGYTGKGKLIAFTDDYFSATHEVFAGKATEIISNGQPLVDDGAGNLVPNSHGISVASVAAGRSATQIGTAPDASVMFGTWDEASMAQFGQLAFANSAIAWNNSWGYRGAGLNQAAFDSIFRVGSGVEYLATLDLYSSQNVVVFAVSNSNLRNATLMDGLPLLQNGLEAGWLAVANGVPTLNGGSVTAVHLLSNSCWEAARWCLVADGSWRVASDESTGYSFATGSSFAAPQVSGALAVLAEAFPDLSPHQLRVRLLASAEDGFFTPDATVELAQGYSKGYSVIYGHGFLDIEAALRPIGKLAMATMGGGQVPAGQPVLKTGSALGDAVTLSLSGTDVAVKDALAASFAMPAEALTAEARAPSRAKYALDRTLATDLRAARQAAPQALSQPFAAFDGPMIGLSGPEGVSATILLPQDGAQAMGISLARALTDGPTRLDLGVKFARDDGALMSLDGDQADMASISLGLTQELAEGAFLTLAGEVGTTDLGGDTALGTSGSARFDAASITIGQTGIFTDDDRLTIGVGMPVAVASGRTDLTLPVTSKAGASFQTVAVDLSPDDRQLDLEIGYQTALTQSLEMKLSFLHSDNFGNRAGQTETGGLVAFTLRF